MRFLALLPIIALSACTASPDVITADEKGHSLTRISDSGEVRILSVPEIPHNVQVSADGKWVLATGMRMDAGMDMEHKHVSAEIPAGDLMIIDAAEFFGKPLRSVAVGDHPAHVITDASGKTAYVTDSAKNRIVIVDIASSQVTGYIPVGRFPHGERMNASGSELYTANVSDGTVSVVDLRLNKETQRIHVGNKPIQVAVTPDDKKLYVTLAGDIAVGVVDLKTYKKIKAVPVPNAPAQIYADPKSRYMYVADQGDVKNPGSMLSVIDTASDTLMRNINTGRMPHGVVADDEGRFIYVTNMGEHTVSKVKVEGFKVITTFNVGQSPNGITLTQIH